MLDLLMLALLGAGFAALCAFVALCDALTRRPPGVEARP